MRSCVGQGQWMHEVGIGGEGALTQEGPHHPDVAKTQPNKRKSTNTADTTVTTLRTSVSPNLASRGRAASGFVLWLLAASYASATTEQAFLLRVGDRRTRRNKPTPQLRRARK